MATKLQASNTTPPPAAQLNEVSARPGPKMSVQTLRQEIPLRRRKIFKKSISKILTFGIALGILSIVFFGVLKVLAEPDSPFYLSFIGSARTAIAWTWIMIVGAIICWNPFYQFLYFVTYYYDMDEKNVVIRKGVLTKREITLPFSKITDVYVDQDLFDFTLGLYDVHISTPTVESGKFAHIDGVDKRGAAKLRKMILDRVNDDTEEDRR